MAPVGKSGENEEKMKKETAAEFFGYAGDQPDSEIYETKKENEKQAFSKARRIYGTYIVRFEVQDMCSSKFGMSKLVIIGPECTIKTLKEAEQTRLDKELASTEKWPVAYVKVPE